MPEAAIISVEHNRAKLGIDDVRAARSARYRQNAVPQPALFEVIRWTDISHALKRRATVRVMMNVTELPSLNDMKHVAHSVRRQQAELWDEITVFVYLPSMDTDGPAYGIAEYRGRDEPQMEVQDFALVQTEWYEQTARAKRQREEELRHRELVKKGGIAAYRMELVANLGEARTVSVECETNLPEGTIVSVSVARLYFMRGADADRGAYAEPYYEADLPVVGGRVVASVSMEDAAWRKRVMDDAKRLRSLTLDMHVDRISDEVTVRTLYTSHNKAHPARVVEVLGANGQFVGGDQSEKVGKGRALSVETSLKVPIEK